MIPLSVILTIVEEAVKVAPQFAAELKTLLSKPNPTAADWAAQRAKVEAMDYDTLVPSSSLLTQLQPLSGPLIELTIVNNASSSSSSSSSSAPLQRPRNSGGGSSSSSSSSSS